MVLALVGGLWWFNNSDREPPTVVATSCSGFETDAHQLFDKGDTVALSGTFAPGDHVHLAIDFNGVGYSWELTGVLATTNVDVTGPGPFTSNKFTTTYTKPTSTKPTSTTAHGDISGFATLEVELDVPTAGDGAITINKTSSVPSITSPRVASASCYA
jgi:hypothetical protein